MKGIVFSVKHREHHYSPNKLSVKSIKRLWGNYGLQILFLLIFILGIVLGSFAYGSLDSEILKKLDFLFMTDLDSRLTFTAFDLFCTSFASGFLFVFSAFLLSFTVWGMFALPLLCAFKGYSVGLASAHMFSQYSITGIGFYILVVLPGTVLFLFVFITALKEAFSQSVYLLKMYFSPLRDNFLIERTKTYLFRNTVVLAFTALSSVVDMVLFLLFADMFKF